ncbi:MAG: hypothetical protein K6A30_07295 [Lachnospiraceae bacterium]|nr:hypothetical protein [Lachnospiraceae bacterium]
MIKKTQLPKRIDMATQVAATLAIENMHISKKGQEYLLAIARGERTSKEILAELDKIYGR